LQQTRILYAEDYDLVLFTVKHLLELEGWLVDICRDGAVALKKLESTEPHDVIVLDAELPGIDGLSLLRHARTLRHRAATPVIMFSANDCEDEALAAGATAYLKKPSGIRELVSTIENVLNGHAA
jgi:DNA-binding response OmpR family regulator